MRVRKINIREARVLAARVLPWEINVMLLFESLR